jgi:hypothetical protein
MDILKAFSLLDTDYQINIQGTLEDPIFQANQIGRLLGISNIHDSTKDFSEKEKYIDLTYTPCEKISNILCEVKLINKQCRR